MTGPIATVFAAEHQALRAMLRDCLATPAGVDLARFEQFRQALLHHIAVEEKVLLPALERKLGHPTLMHEAMRKDHAGVAALCVPAPNRAWVEALQLQLEEHHRVEEGDHGFFALCDLWIADEAPAVLAAAREFPPLHLTPFNDGRRVRDHLAEVLEATGLAS